jgi:hypothetical protein
MLTHEHTLVLAPALSAIREVAKENIRPSSNEIIFALGSEHFALRIPDGGEITIGRCHPSNKTQPSIDLTKYGAGLYGVSRLHATIRHEHNLWWLTDNGSSNGTWINGERVAPLVPTLLQPVSTICLAKMDIRIILPTD